MQNNKRAPHINDAEESISFDSPISKQTASTASQNSANLLLDIPTPGGSAAAAAADDGGAVGNLPSPGAYDYIETVDYLQQLGSEPASPETAAPSNSTSVNMSGLNMSMITNESVFESSHNCSAKQQYENLPITVNATTDNHTTADNHTTSATDNHTTSATAPKSGPVIAEPTHAAAPSSQQNCVQNNLPFDVEATPENGFGKGAVPKRRPGQESYYHIWGPPNKNKI